MNISHEDFNQHTFAYNECNKLEYKELFQAKSITKYIETICGILNSGGRIFDSTARELCSLGGKLIFGIRDDLLLVGLKSSAKDIDKFILGIDDITGNRQIIGITPTEKKNETKHNKKIKNLPFY